MAKPKPATARPASRPKRSKPMGLRLEPALSDALDAEVERQRAAHPGRDVHRSDVIREILHAALLGKGRPG